jgi:hypothetical protein
MPRLRGEGMSLRGNDPRFFDTALMLSLAGGVCLSWPQVGRSIVLVTKIVLFYCLSPR